MTDSVFIKSFQEQLLAWYRKHQRKLPWRETKDPYKIWVSEIMLQQTRVETVIPYYQNFLSTFPTVQELAKADEQEVLKKWQGLGYYRRAKLIHKAAKEISASYNGKLPSTRDELQKLPGFGPYTSGAVASIAFDEAVPAVDGNVKRVLSRIFATHDPVDTIAEIAAKVDSPSDWTQALMELGALICIPKNPKCLACPVQSLCKAYAMQAVDQYPTVTKKTKVKEIFATTWMIQHPTTKQLLIQQRPEDGRWSKMWEFPTDEFEQKPSEPTNSMTKTSGKNIGKFKHLLTHRTMHIDVLLVEPKKSIELNAHQKWAAVDQLTDFPFSKMQMRALEIFRKLQS